LWSEIAPGQLKYKRNAAGYKRQNEVKFNSDPSFKELSMLETKPVPVPAILDMEQAIEEFVNSVHPLINPEQAEAWDGVKVKEKEWAIVQAALRLAGQCIAILLYRLVLSQSVQRAAQARVPGKPGSMYTNQQFREVGITLIGGVQVRVKTLYRLARQRRQDKRGRKRKRGQRGGSHGQGYYPVLGLLGIREGVTPLIRCLSAQAATQMASLEYARQALQGFGLHFSTRRVRHLSRAFCAVGLERRADQLARFAAGEAPVGEALRGKRVVIQVDGGRVRTRHPKRRGRKRKSGRHGYSGEWKEPKLLMIYVLDEQGHKLVRTGIPLICDGTLMGLDAFLSLLRMYLHELGIASAETIVLLGDGAPWIWDNLPNVLTQLGCRAEQVVQILDYYHATENLYKLAEALFGDTPSAKGWAKMWAKRLQRGHARALLLEIDRRLAKKVRCPKTAQTQANYFKTHQAHARLDYAYFQKQDLPIGSGPIESLIRQVVNLRLKGAGKFWLLETAEAFLHARCQAAAQRWSDFCNEVLTYGLAPI
jgi:hypothetical protein